MKTQTKELLDSTNVYIEQTEDTKIPWQWCKRSKRPSAGAKYSVIDEILMRLPIAIHINSSNFPMILQLDPYPSIMQLKFTLTKVTKFMDSNIPRIKLDENVTFKIVILSCLNKAASP